MLLNSVALLRQTRVSPVLALPTRRTVVHRLAPTSESDDESDLRGNKLCELSIEM